MGNRTRLADRIGSTEHLHGPGGDESMDDADNLPIEFGPVNRG